MEWQVELLCIIVHKLCIGLRLGTAKIVIDMDNGEPKREFRAEFQEDMQEANRVCAPGHGDSHAVAGVQHLVAGHSLADAV